MGSYQKPLGGVNRTQLQNYVLKLFCRGFAYYTPQSNNNALQSKSAIDAGIKMCSVYTGLDDARAHFLSYVSSYRNNTTYTTSSARLNAFYKNVCGMDTEANAAAGNGATLGTNHPYSKMDNDGILGTSCGQSSKCTGLDTVPYVDIISETDFKKYIYEDYVPEAHRSQDSDNAMYIHFNKVYNTKTPEYTKHKVLCFNVEKRNSSGAVIKDYNIRFMTLDVEGVGSTDGNPVRVNNTFENMSDQTKINLRYFYSKLPVIFDKIEEATGMQPGYPIDDQDPTSPRYLYWIGIKGAGPSVSGFSGKVGQSKTRILNLGRIEHLNFYEESRYQSFASDWYVFVDTTNATTKANTIKKLANNGGSNNGWQTYADIIQHEMLHYTQFMNMKIGAQYLYTWFKEGFADLIRSGTRTRMYSEKGGTYAAGNHWERLFWRTIASDSANTPLGFE